MIKQPQCNKPPATVIFEDSEGVSHDSGICERSLNLLAHAQAIELDIGSRCGGQGICGGDRVRIAPSDTVPGITTTDSATGLGNADPSAATPAAAGLSPLTAPELEHLSPEEIQAGWRLACQCFPDKADEKIQLFFSNRIGPIS